MVIYICFLQIAGDLLDLVGDSAFETVQDLIMVSLKFGITLLSEVYGMPFS